MRALILIEAHGKAEAWAKIVKSLGLSAHVVATGGHVCRFPQALDPIGIDLRPGKRVDALRRLGGDVRKRILADVDELPAGAPILIATDDDIEGDVIAFDLIEMILTERKARGADLRRVRPGAITPAGIRASIREASPVATDVRSLVGASIQGRARAVTDRWIGSVFSRQAGIPVGRVRSAIVGMTFLWNAAPDRLRGVVETGEIILQARSGAGGKPFFARVGVFGDLDKTGLSRLAGIARKYQGRMIPGIVRPRASLSAAVAPRFGDVPLFNTGDAIAYASRHFGISPKQAMTGLQDAYLRGLISYPRVDSRSVGIESAGRITQIGAACGLPGLDPYHLADPAPEGVSRAHEGLHPVSSINAGDVAALSSVVRLNVAKKRDYEREEVMQIMQALVARRAFEASRQIGFEMGNWHPDNISGADVFDVEDIEVLRDLDWQRESGPAFPWARDMLTGVRLWPIEAVLMDGLMTEGVGRPSTFAAHIETAITSGDILPGENGALPRPSPQGVTTLQRTPRAIWNPATCRTIEMILENEGNALEEDEGASLHLRVRHRVLTWLRLMPDGIRDALLDALSIADGSGAPAAGAPSTASADAGDTAYDQAVSTDIPRMAPGGF